MKEVDLAYVAGLFDGEGTVTLTKSNSWKRFKSPQVSITSTTYEIIAFLQEKFGGYVCKQKVYKTHHKQSWSWRLTNDTVFPFLQAIIKYMKEPTKIYRANLLLEEYKKVTPRNGKYSEEMSAKKLDFQERFFHPSNA